MSNERGHANGNRGENRASCCYSKWNMYVEAMLKDITKFQKEVKLRGKG